MPVLMNNGFFDTFVTSLMSPKSKLSPDGIFHISIPILFKISIDLVEKTDALKRSFFFHMFTNFQPFLI